MCSGYSTSAVLRSRSRWASRSTPCLVFLPSPDGIACRSMKEGRGSRAGGKRPTARPSLRGRRSLLDRRRAGGPGAAGHERGLRSEPGACDFATLRSVIATARKQGWNVLDTLAHLDPVQLNSRLCVRETGAATTPDRHDPSHPDARDNQTWVVILQGVWSPRRVQTRVEPFPGTEPGRDRAAKRVARPTLPACSRPNLRPRGPRRGTRGGGGERAMGGISTSPGAGGRTIRATWGDNRNGRAGLAAVGVSAATVGRVAVGDSAAAGRPSVLGWSPGAGSRPVRARRGHSAELRPLGGAPRGGPRWRTVRASAVMDRFRLTPEWERAEDGMQWDAAAEGSSRVRGRDSGQGGGR